MPTALTTYLANAASTVLASANQLYASGAGSPTTNQTITTMGTATGYGEILPRGGTAWAASGSIGAPTGNGFLLDASTLGSQQIVAGSWSAVVRLVAMQAGSQAGSMTADIHVRAYKYSSGTYTQIIDMSLTGQTINATLTNYSLSGTTASATNFGASDHIYVDVWLNITVSSGSSAQGVRINRLSTDTTTFIGDATAEVVTPGYQASGGTTVSLTVTETATGTETVIDAIAARIAETATGTETVTQLAKYSATITDTATGTETVLAALVARVNETATGTEQAIPAIVDVVNETASGSEVVTSSAITVSPADAQMTTTDMAMQYSRIKASAAGAVLNILASVYYGNSSNTQVIYGELDALLKGETISQLHAMRTRNDVTAFLRAYAYATNVQADQPIAYYRLGELAGGLAYDLAGRGFNGVINGGVTLGQPGALAISTDTAMLFDGSSGYIALPYGVNPANWPGITIEAWVKLSNTTFTGYERLISNDFAQSNNKGFELIISPSTDGTSGYFAMGFGGTHANFGFGSSVLTAGTWYHLACTYNGTTAIMYINGVAVRTSSATGLIAPTTNAITIGRSPVTGNYLPGTIDEVAIYNYALSAGRVLVHYNSGINP